MAAELLTAELLTAELLTTELLTTELLAAELLAAELLATELLTTELLTTELLTAKLVVIVPGPAGVLTERAARHVGVAAHRPEPAVRRLRFQHTRQRKERKHAQSERQPHEPLLETLKHGRPSPR